MSLVSGLPSPSFVERAVDYFGGRAYIPILAWLAGTAFLSLPAYALIFSRRRQAIEEVPEGGAGAGGSAGASER